MEPLATLRPSLIALLLALALACAGCQRCDLAWSDAAQIAGHHRRVATPQAMTLHHGLTLAAPPSATGARPLHHVAVLVGPAGISVETSGWWEGLPAQMRERLLELADEAPSDPRLDPRHPTTPFPMPGPDDRRGGFLLGPLHERLEALRGLEALLEALDAEQPPEPLDAPDPRALARQQQLDLARQHLRTLAIAIDAQTSLEDAVAVLYTAGQAGFSRMALVMASPQGLDQVVVAPWSSCFDPLVALSGQDRQEPPRCVEPVVQVSHHGFVVLPQTSHQCGVHRPAAGDAPHPAAPAWHLKALAGPGGGCPTVPMGEALQMDRGLHEALARLPSNDPRCPHATVALGGATTWDVAINAMAATRAAGFEALTLMSASKDLPSGCDDPANRPQPTENK